MGLFQVIKSGNFRRFRVHFSYMVLYPALRELVINHDFLSASEQYVFVLNRDAFTRPEGSKK